MISKVFQSIILSILITSTLSIPILDANCEDKNPFLRILGSSGVQILEEVSFQKGTKCKTEWEEFGTCCDIDGLIEYANNDHQSIRLAVRDTKIKVYEISTLLTNLLQNVKWIAKNEDIFLGKRTTTIIGPLLLKIEPKIKLTTSITNSPNFNKSIDSCWKTMKKARSNSLCPSCSGRSELFFERGKAIISENVCAVIMNDCSSWFSQISRFTRMIDETLETMIVSLEIENDPELFPLEDTINRVIQSQARGHVERLLKEYHLLDESEKAESNVTRTLCQKLLKISKDPFITNSLEFYSALVEMIERIGDDLFNSHEKDKKVKSEWRVESARNNERLLLVHRNSRRVCHDRNKNQTKGLYQGDVVVFPWKDGSTYSSKSIAVDGKYIKSDTHIPLPIDMKDIFP